MQFQFPSRKVITQSRHHSTVSSQVHTQPYCKPRYICSDWRRRFRAQEVNMWLSAPELTTETVGDVPSCIPPTSPSHCPGYNSAVKAHLEQPDTTSATARLKASTRDISAFGESLSRSVWGISRPMQASTLQETERHSTQKEFNRVSCKTVAPGQM